MVRLHMAVTIADRTVSVTLEAAHTPPATAGIDTGTDEAAGGVTGLGADLEVADESAPAPDDVVPFGYTR